MLFEIDGDAESGDTKINAKELDTTTTSYNINNNTKLIYDPSNISISSTETFSKLTIKVFNSKNLLEHILSYIPIESLYECSRVCSNWHLIIKYIVPIPLVHLKTLSFGELVYWLPGENQFPKTVLLKLRFSLGKPKFLEILTSVEKTKKTENRVKNGFISHEQNEPELIVRNGHYQMLELSEILFVISGHWTPIFESLQAIETTSEFDMDESQFFHRSKCFSIVTNTYMSYDFISFNSETNSSIVNTMRHIMGQTHEKSQKMAIYAKANKKYSDLNIPLIFTDTLSALNFEMFVLILQDTKNKIGSELNIDIPTIIESEANASSLYPQILDENVMFSEWGPWARAHILDILKKNGYIKQTEDVYNDDDEEKDDDNKSISMSMDEEQQDNNHRIEVLYDGKKHRKQSSLFGLKQFPMDESYDLFSGIRHSDDEEEDEFFEDNEFERTMLRQYGSKDSHRSIGSNHSNNINNNVNDLNDPSNCTIM